MDTTAIADIATVPIHFPTLSKLPQDEQVRLYRLARAEAAARRFRDARAPKMEARAQTVLSGILKAKSRVPVSIFQKVGRYAEQYRLHGGPRDAWTGDRLRPAFIPGELAAAAQAALESGVDLGLDDYEDADLGANRLELLDRYLGSLRPVLYGTPSAAPAPQTAPAPKVGDTDAPLPSSPKASSAVQALIAVLPPDEAAALKPLTDLFQTGDPTRYTAYLNAWVKAARTHELVAFFDETSNTGTYGTDVLPGRFQLIAAVQDADHTPMVQKIARKASYFERLLPGNAMFKRPLKSIVPPATAAYRVIAADPWSEAIDAGAFSYPVPWFAQNGRDAKVLLFLDAAQAREKATGEAVAAAFSADEPTRFLRLKWRETTRTAFLVLKNVIGYHAGTRKSDATGDRALSQLKGIWEEIHADLVALHFSVDAEVAASGLVPEPECARALLLGYVSGLLEQAIDATEESSLRYRRAAARRVVVRGLLKSGAVSVDRVDGHFQVLLRDEAAARKNIEEQLAEAARILALGALDDAQSIVDTDGGPLPKSWRTDAVARLSAAGVAPKNAYLFSRIIAAEDAAGNPASISAEPVGSLSQWIAEPREKP